MSRGNDLFPEIDCIEREDDCTQFRSNMNGSRKPSFIELEMPMNLDDKFESYLISAHSDWDQTFVSKH